MAIGSIEHPLGAVGVDGEQHRVLLLGRAAHEELALARARPGRRHGAGPEQLSDAVRQPLAAGQTAALGLASNASCAADHAPVSGAAASSSQR